MSVSHDFTKGPFEIASQSNPSYIEPPFHVENLSNMIKHHQNNQVGQHVNDTANFHDDSYVIYKDMINNINNNPTSPILPPKSKLQMDPAMQVDDVKQATVLANVQSAVSFKKKESKRVLT